MLNKPPYFQPDCVAGKQHDVAECMDNCMFQIETALLRFDGGNDIIDKTSVVKRYLCLLVDDLQLKFVPIQIVLWQNPPAYHKRRWPTFSIVNT